MNKIPIVFCFDDNLLMPAGVCISSLLVHAKEDTFYDIFILHKDHAVFPDSAYLEKLYERYTNFEITYRSVENTFEDAFETRGITIAAYYRLLIPKLIPEYDKIFYFDVDIIFQSDLSAVYYQTDMKEFYVAGVSTPYSDIEKYINEVIGMEVDQYICSGTILLNSHKLLEDDIIDRFIEEAKVPRRYQDQDVLNLVCRDKIKILDPWFGVVGTVNEIAAMPQQEFYSQEQIDEIRRCGIVHYNGAKPWKGWCYNFDIWWAYYQKSVFFDRKFYFDFYHAKLNEYDNLSLWKRIKILLRYFKTRV